MNHKRHYSQDLLIIASFTLITVIIWIGLTIYQSLKTPTIPKVLEDQLRPIKSDFDTQAIDALNLRKRVSQQELDQLPVRALEFETKETEKRRESTSSAQPAEPEEETIEETGF